MALLPSLFRENVNDASTISLSGRQFYVHSENPWSFDSQDNNTLRFEVRKGDQYSGNGYTDSSGVERSEIGDAARYAINQNISVEYKFMIEPGAKNTAKWMVMGQLHSAMNMSPPVEIKFTGNDKMKISGNSGSTSNPVYRDIYSDSQDIVRGHWYTMKLNIKFDPYGNGSAEIYRDGVKIVDYRGALGYTDQTQTYWKEGVYRSTASETTAVNFKDLVIKTGVNAFAVTAATAPELQAAVSSSGSRKASLGDKELQGTSGHDNIDGGSGHDSIYGWAGRDKLNGRSGNDRIDGGQGSDTMTGAAGNDVLSGSDGNDRISGGSGHDHLFGGNGRDRLFGGKGNDKLSGGGGKDSLTGGEGADKFLLNSANAHGADSILDFDAAHDRIDLAGAVFKSLSKGHLKSSEFAVGPFASTAEQHILYDTMTGSIYYDADGSGGGAAVHIATLKGAPSISASDFYVI